MRFNVNGGGNANIDVVLLSSGDIPAWVNLWPRNSVSVFTKWHF